MPSERRRRKSFAAPLAIRGLFLLAVAYTLYFAADLLIPIAFSGLLSILFFPLVQKLARRGIPRWLTSGFIVSAIILATGLGFSTLSEPAQTWLQDAPHSIRQLKREMLQSDDKLEDIQALAEEVDKLADVDNDEDKGRDINAESPQPVVVKGPGIFKQLVGNLPRLVGTSIVIVFLTFFMLSTGDSLLLKITRLGRSYSERKRIVTVARRIQSDLSRYLATVTVVNICLGVATGLVLYLLGVPNPVLWGTMAGLFNFAPYVGALVSTLVLTVVGLTHFPTLGESFAVPGSFLVLTILEGQLITPAVIGRHMSINPMMVLLSVVVWGWLWGIPGALMAVPILASLRAICEHVPPLRLVGPFLTNEVGYRPDGRSGSLLAATGKGAAE